MAAHAKLTTNAHPAALITDGEMNPRNRYPVD